MSSALDGFHVQKNLNPTFADQKNGLRWDEGQVYNGLKPGVSGDMKHMADDTIWREGAYPTNREWKGEVINHPYGRFIFK